MAQKIKMRKKYTHTIKDVNGTKIKLSTRSQFNDYFALKIDANNIRIQKDYLLKTKHPNTGKTITLNQIKERKIKLNKGERIVGNCMFLNKRQLEDLIKILQQKAKTLYYDWSEGYTWIKISPTTSMIKSINKIRNQK